MSIPRNTTKYANTLNNYYVYIIEQESKKNITLLKFQNIPKDKTPLPDTPTAKIQPHKIDKVPKNETSHKTHDTPAPKTHPRKPDEIIEVHT